MPPEPKKNWTDESLGWNRPNELGYEPRKRSGRAAFLLVHEEEQNPGEEKSFPSPAVEATGLSR